MPTLDQQMAHRREQILEAARAVIESHGYEGLTMRSLAAESGVTVPTIYNLVGNKEQVLFAAVEEQTRGFINGLERASGNLVAVVEATVRQLVRRPRYYRALLVALANSESTDSARRLVGRSLAQQLAAGLEEIAGAGELADWIETRVLTQRLQAHLDATSLEWARGQLTAAGFRAAALFDVATSMLGVCSGAARRSFEVVARENQGEAARRSRAPRARGRAA